MERVLKNVLVSYFTGVLVAPVRRSYQIRLIAPNKISLGIFPISFALRPFALDALYAL
jgi:hypothetical protein